MIPYRFLSDSFTSETQPGSQLVQYDFLFFNAVFYLCMYIACLYLLK